MSTYGGTCFMVSPKSTVSIVSIIGYVIGGIIVLIIIIALCQSQANKRRRQRELALAAATAASDPSVTTVNYVQYTSPVTTVPQPIIYSQPTVYAQQPDYITYPQPTAVYSQQTGYPQPQPTGYVPPSNNYHPMN